LSERGCCDKRGRQESELNFHAKVSVKLASDTPDMQQG
jgi:hypothetical protein